MDVSDIFFLLGGGKGRGVRGARRGGWFFIENPRGGVSRRRGGGGERGREGVCSKLAGGGGGLNIFFQGRNSFQEDYTLKSRGNLICNPVWSNGISPRRWNKTTPKFSKPGHCQPARGVSQTGQAPLQTVPQFETFLR